MRIIDIGKVTDRINTTPRKCPRWKMPTEVFAAKIVEVTGRRRCFRSRQTSHSG